MGATYEQTDCQRQLTLEAVPSAGAVVSLPDGRAGVLTQLNVSQLAIGDRANFNVEGVYRVPKTTGIVILDGGKVFWDRSAAKAHFKTGNDRDFYLGVAVGDAASADTEMLVNINVLPAYLVDMARDPFAQTIVLTAGTPTYKRLGGAHAMAFSATAEAQKVDMLSRRGFDASANMIVEATILVVNNGDAAAIDFNIGLADGTHASDFDSISKYLALHIDGNSVNLNLQSTDGTTTVAATDTTKDLSVGTPFQVWFDCRDQADVQVYIDGVNVLPDSVFDLSAATLLYLLAHVEKSADDTPGEYHVYDFAARIAEQ